MSLRFKRNLSELQKLHRASPQKKKTLLKSANSDLIGALCDCACNIIKGNVPLTSKQFNNLRKHHKQLKALTNKSSVKNKRKIIQKGGFIGLLLKPLAKILMGGLLN